MSEAHTCSEVYLLRLVIAIIKGSGKITQAFCGVIDGNPTSSTLFFAQYTPRRVNNAFPNRNQIILPFITISRIIASPSYIPLICASSLFVVLSRPFSLSVFYAPLFFFLFLFLLRASRNNRTRSMRPAWLAFSRWLHPASLFLAPSLEHGFCVYVYPDRLLVSRKLTNTNKSTIFAGSSLLRVRVS